MKTILALDSASDNCSAAVFHQHEMSICSEYAPRKHTQLMLPLMKQALAERALTLNDVGALAFGAGPGSFTGIRIAAGVAQGLAYGLDVPIYAVSSLEALALQSYLEHKISQVLVCIDARMSEVYWGMFEVTELDGRYRVTVLAEEQVTAPALVHIPDDIMHRADQNAIAGIGSGLEFLDETLFSLLTFQERDAQPRADAIAFLAEAALLEGMPGNLSEALPRYVRDTVTWNKLPGRE